MSAAAPSDGAPSSRPADTVMDYVRLIADEPRTCNKEGAHLDNRAQLEAPDAGLKVNRKAGVVRRHQHPAVHRASDAHRRTQSPAHAARSEAHRPQQLPHCELGRSERDIDRPPEAARGEVRAHAVPARGCAVPVHQHVQAANRRVHARRKSAVCERGKVDCDGKQPLQNRSHMRDPERLRRCRNAGPHSAGDGRHSLACSLKPEYPSHETTANPAAKLTAEQCGLATGVIGQAQRRATAAADHARPAPQPAAAPASAPRVARRPRERARRSR